MENHLKLAGMPTRLAGIVSDEHIEELAKNAETQWTSTFNPINLAERDFQEIYMSLIEQ